MYQSINYREEVRDCIQKMYLYIYQSINYTKGVRQCMQKRYLYIPMNQLHRGGKTTYTEEYLTTKICNNIFFVWNSDYTITADIDNSLRNSIYTSTRLTKAKILDNHRSVFCSLGISTKDKERVSIRSKRFIGFV
jgi:hypothetical protein